MNINFFRMLLMTFLAVAGLAACSDDDEPKDSVKRNQDAGVGRNRRDVCVGR